MRILLSFTTVSLLIAFSAPASALNPFPICAVDFQEDPVDYACVYIDAAYFEPIATGPVDANLVMVVGLATIQTQVGPQTWPGAGQQSVCEPYFMYECEPFEEHFVYDKMVGSDGTCAILLDGAVWIERNGEDDEPDYSGPFLLGLGPCL